MQVFALRDTASLPENFQYVSEAVAVRRMSEIKQVWEGSLNPDYLFPPLHIWPHLWVIVLFFLESDKSCWSESTQWTYKDKFYPRITAATMIPIQTYKRTIQEDILLHYNKHNEWSVFRNASLAACLVSWESLHIDGLQCLHRFASFDKLRGI